MIEIIRSGLFEEDEMILEEVIVKVSFSKV